MITARAPPNDDRRLPAQSAVLLHDPPADGDLHAPGGRGTGTGGRKRPKFRTATIYPREPALDRFAGLGVATAFTEVDVRSVMTPAVQAGDSSEINPRLQASAANYSALMQACLSSQHCISFTVWGFTDKHSWVPGWFTNPPEGLATLYDANYQPKRAYNVLRADLAVSGRLRSCAGSRNDRGRNRSDRW